MSGYPYCPGPGDEATWGPAWHPMDPRIDLDDEDAPEEDSDDEPDGSEEDYEAHGTPAPLLGELIKQIIEPGSTAYVYRENAEKPVRRKNKKKRSVAEWTDLVYTLISEQPGVTACGIRDETGISSKPLIKVFEALNKKTFFLMDGNKRRYFLGAIPQMRTARLELLKQFAK